MILSEIMNKHQLLQKFNQGINWNAILSISHRILSVILSYSLYLVCSATDYNFWANAYAIIFIMVLWIDGGLRKSAPRFAPLFAAEGKTRSFVTFLFVFQVIALTLTAPLIVVGIRSLQSTIGIIGNYVWPILMIFFLEGINSCIRLIYHSYFWHKSYNQTYVLLLTLETIIAGFFIIKGITPLIPAIFMLKISTCMLLIMITARKIPLIINDPAYQHIAVSGSKNTVHQCAIHTFAMWGSNAIKSLSERNVIMLVFTYLFGAEQANIFKIANDGAVIVYRTLMKTIGTTDTSLLAHSQILEEGKVGLQKAFKKVSTKVVGLCIPLLGIIAGIYTVVSLNVYDYDVFHIMFILISGYVLEVAFSSYERVLEINFRYRYLVYAYVPYIILISLPFIPLLTPYLPLVLSTHTYTLTSITSIGLVTLLISIRGVRLVSAFLMVHFARRLYDLEWPVAFRVWASRLVLFYIGGIPIGIVLLYIGRSVVSFVSLVSSLGRVSI
jgi:hypothetical protein